MSHQNDDIDAEEEQSKTINEEYKTWKKHAPLLYDLVVSHTLEWPSLTCQWFPDTETSADKDYTTHRLLLGTNTSNIEQNMLHIAQIKLPKQSEDLDPAKFEEDKGEIGSYSASNKVEIVQSINHDGEVNRARYSPYNPDLIATRTVMGPIYIFDRTRHELKPKADGSCNPQIVLRGHEGEGYGMEWSPLKANHIISASTDTTVRHWDISNYQTSNNILDPINTYRGHTAAVEDISWHASHENVFASVSDDQHLFTWDTRDATQPHQRVKAHDADINCVAFSPSQPFLCVTGSADKTIGLWDLRNLKKRLHSIEGHSEDVLNLEWSPHAETVFASASSDRRVCMWDISRIGEEQTPEDAEDGPPELMFMHGGHTNAITDIAWSKTLPFTLMSSSEDNILQLWSPSSHLYAAEEVPIEIDELE
ncbi:hypothetical protein E3P99_00916 [Wallemia hederae]|uniref:Histone-binding protein RBBP4-like N-terminal domain-containing protein n=1 Tax=Wallemia hederae TaxID=1540922 RepID=A0A4V4LTV7_9BASI|nr:hypothetical protein E3P99_00916 [Wallemia hederae]